MRGEFTKLGNLWIRQDEKDLGVFDHLNRNPSDVSAWHSYMIPIIIDKFFQNKSARTAIDCGTCYGMIAIPLAKYFNIVHTFEPNERLWFAIEQNILTHKKENIILHKTGLGSCEQYVNFSVSKSSGSSFVERHNNPKNKNIKITSIDDQNIIDVDLIKIDVEGYEFEVLQGAKNTLKTYKPLLIVEIHKTSNNFTKTIKYLLEQDYVLTYIHRKDDYIFVHKDKL